MNIHRLHFLAGITLGRVWGTDGGTSLSLLLFC